MQTRVFGRSGIRLPVLGLGCQRLVDTHGCREDQALAILHAALDSGIRYFDTAWVYSLGQSERRLGLVARHRRTEMWIATKALDRTRDGALRQLEQSLGRLQTDHVDEWRLHHVAGMAELDRCCAPGGALRALVEARDQGLARHLGISGHTDPRVQVEALRRFPFDSILFSASPADPFHDDFVGGLLPAAAATGAAAVAMRVLAGGQLGRFSDQAIRYGLTLPVSIVLVGCMTLAQLEQDLRLAKAHEPFASPERQAFLARVRALPVRPPPD